MTKSSSITQANDVLQYRYEELPLRKEFRSVLGRVPKLEQWTMLLHGIEGSGKSTYSLVLANEFTRYGNVLYGNFEEAIGPTLKEKIQTAKIRTNKIHFLTNNIQEELWKQLKQEQYKYCIVDSLSQIVNKEREIMEFWGKLKQHTDVSFILISHSTKTRDGKNESNYKGHSTIGHLVDIKQKVVSGVVWNDRKNRYLGKNCAIADGYDIFNRKLVKPKQDR